MRKSQIQMNRFLSPLLVSLGEEDINGTTDSNPLIRLSVRCR